MLRYGTLSWKLRHVMMGSGLGGCVNVPDTSPWKWCYATAHCLGSCVMSWWGQGWAGVLTFVCWRSWHLHLKDDATLRHVVLEVASCHDGVRVGRVCWRSFVNVPDTCVLKMMLRYGTSSWKLRHVMMGSGLGGCVDVPDTCVLKMMLH